MSRFRPNSSFLFLLLVVVSSTPFTLSSSDSLAELFNWKSLDLSSKPLFSVGNKASSNSTVLILAANRTYRKDPTDGFKYYTGGWNITNPHYVSSVAYSAVPLFITALVWFVSFALLLILMWVWRCCCCCCRRKKLGYSQVVYAICLTLLIVLTASVVAGSIYLFVGQGRFHTSIVNVVDFLLQQARTLVQTLKDISDSLAGAKDLSVGEIKLPEELRANIDQMHGQISNLTGMFFNVTTNSTKNIAVFLNPMRLALIYVSSFMIILAFLGLLLSFCGLQCLVSILTIIAWIAIVGTFILSGMFLLVHNAVADTCVAVEDFLQNPTANSALENLLPRANKDLAEAIMNGTKGVTYALVNATDASIVHIYNADLPPDAGPLYYNQSGPQMPLLCNPFDETLGDRQCAPGEVEFVKAPEVWKNYICQVSDSGICITPGRLTPTGYSNLTSSINISYTLYHFGPFLVNLVDSTYMKQTFSNISTGYCPSLQKYSMWTYSGFSQVSYSMLVSVILWIVLAREQSHRRYTKKRVKKSMDSENPFAYGGIKKW